jgi:cell division protease FtsH
MVGRWGMSAALGPVSLLPGPGHQPTFGFDGEEPAPATLELFDAEVRRLLEEADARARTVLGEHRAQLDALVEALLVGETLDAEEAYRAAGIARPVRTNGTVVVNRPVGTA